MTCICSVHWVTLTGRSRCRVCPLQMLHNLHRGICSKCAFRWGAVCLHICLKRELQGSSSAPEHEIDWTLGHGSGLQQKPKLCGRKGDAFLLLVRILDNACCVVYSCASVLELGGVRRSAEEWQWLDLKQTNLHVMSLWVTLWRGLTQSGQRLLFTHPNSQGEAESRCPACSNDHFSEALPQVLMTLISLLGPTGEQACLVLSGSLEPEHVSHKRWQLISVQGFWS